MAEIAPAIGEAFELLDSSGLVEVTAPLAATENGNVEFRCRIPVPVPNPECLPAKVEVRVVVPAVFPFAPVDVYALDPAARGFPHQDAETQKLCLPEERLAPPDRRRLSTYLQWTIEWFADAGNGTLLKPGDPFELPDFSRKLLKHSPRERRQLWFVENGASFIHWQNRVGAHGTMVVTAACSSRVLAVTRFVDDTGTVLWEPPFSKTFLASSEPLTGHWTLLSDIRFERHRPPQTFDELRQLCARDGVDLDEVLLAAWEQGSKTQKDSIIVFGCPISRLVGGVPTEVHWQPLLIDNIFGEDDSFKLRYSGKRLRRWRQLLQTGRFSGSEQLPWGASVNVSRQRLYARGAFGEVLQGQSLAVVGCGAVGTMVVEILARGGVVDITLFDGDSFEIGNQCRHTLEGAYLGSGKARGLAARLASTNPLSSIRGFEVYLPIAPAVAERKPESVSALDRATIVIDCSTDDTAFVWLSRFAKAQRKTLVHVFVDIHATFLTMCISGKQTSCARVARRLFEAIRAGQTPISPSDYFRDPDEEELVLPGAGCWHPTFPGRNNQIWMLVAAATDVLDDVLAQPERCDGWGIVLERSRLPLDNTTAPSVQRVWLGRYR